MTPEEEQEQKRLLLENERLRNRIRKLEHQHQEDIAEMATQRRYVEYLMESQQIRPDGERSGKDAEDHRADVR